MQLIELYYEIIQNKVVVEGKDSGRFEFVNPTTFTGGYIQHGGDLESEFYREMLAAYQAPTEPKMIFVLIKHVHH